MSYQQPPYQTTVMQPVVVQPVQPVVVPLVSGPAAGISRNGPAFIRNGAKIGGRLVPGNCICCMSVIGGMLVFQSLFSLLLMSNFDMLIPGLLIPGFIGAPFAIISCILCIKAKKNYDIQRSQECTLPYSEPFQDARNLSADGMGGSPMYVPVQQSGGVGVPPGTVYPQGSVVSYPNTAPSPSYPAQMYAIQQPPQPGFNNAAPGAMPYPMPVPGKGSSQEYDQPPAYAPPGYSP